MEIICKELKKINENNSVFTSELDLEKLEIKVYNVAKLLKYKLELHPKSEVLNYMLNTLISFLNSIESNLQNDGFDEWAWKFGGLRLGLENLDTEKNNVSEKFIIKILPLFINFCIKILSLF